MIKLIQKDFFIDHAIPTAYYEFVSDEDFVILPISDLHVDSVDFYEEFYSYINAQIKELNAYVFINGDILDIGFFDNFKSMNEIKLRGAEKEKALRELLYSFKDYTLGILEGNHDERIEKRCGWNPIRDIVSNELQIPYSSDILFTILKINNIEYTFYCAHGSGSGTTKGGQANMLNRSKNVVVNSDLYFLGHTHNPININFSNYIHYPNSKKLTVTNGRQYITPAFLKHASYAKKYGLEPPNYTYYWFTLSHTEKNITEASRSFRSELYADTSKR